MSTVKSTKHAILIQLTILAKYNSVSESVYLHIPLNHARTHPRSWEHDQLASRLRRHGGTGTDRWLSAGCQLVEVASVLEDTPDDNWSHHPPRRCRPPNTSRALAPAASSFHTGPLQTSVKYITFSIFTARRNAMSMLYGHSDRLSVCRIRESDLLELCKI